MPANAEPTMTATRSGSRSAVPPSSPASAQACRAAGHGQVERTRRELRDRRIFPGRARARTPRPCPPRPGGTLRAQSGMAAESRPAGDQTAPGRVHVTTQAGHCRVPHHDDPLRHPRLPLRPAAHPQPIASPATSEKPPSFMIYRHNRRIRLSRFSRHPVDAARFSIIRGIEPGRPRPPDPPAIGATTMRLSSSRPGDSDPIPCRSPNIDRGDPTSASRATRCLSRAACTRAIDDDELRPPRRMRSRSRGCRWNRSDSWPRSTRRKSGVRA